MKKGAGKARSQRQLRVAEEVRHSLVNIIQRGELRDPELVDVSITVSEVQVSPDLKNAKAFVSRLGGGDDETLVKAMERAAPFLRQRIGQELALKFIPAICFQDFWKMAYKPSWNPNKIFKTYILFTFCKHFYCIYFLFSLGNIVKTCKT